MRLNKKSATILAIVSLLLGSAGAIGLQARAQNSNPSTPPAQIQNQSAAGEQNNAATDKDNIQDTKDNGQPESAVETNENLSGGGHQDQAGANADHQFEGVE